MRKSAIVDGGLAKNDETPSIPKGYVPLLVGSEAEERVLVRVRLLKDPCISSLLETAAQELGYGQQGILRLPCVAEHFRWIVNEVSKAL